MTHLYEDKKGIIHFCESSQIVPSDRSTRLVWTKCGKDVPAYKSFNSIEPVTCEGCLTDMRIG
jgi:hypothetical protein